MRFALDDHCDNWLRRLLRSCCRLWPILVVSLSAFSPASAGVYPGTTLRFHPGHYLLDSGANLSPTYLSEVANNPNLLGTSRVYNWIDLEGDTLGSYDFSAITSDLNALKGIGKRLIIMIRDKSFAGNPFIPVPLYLQMPEYSGGFVSFGTNGGIAKRWVPKVAQRYRALIGALGAAFANDPSLEAIKTAETAAGPVTQLGPEYSVVAYTTELMLLADALADAFPNTVRVLYMNWLPGDGRAQLEAVAVHAGSRQVGIGGPDIHPDVAITAYPFYRLLQGIAPLMVDVQYSDYDHPVPPGDTDALLQFGIDTLRVNYVCWQPRAPYMPNLLATIANPVFDSQFPAPPAPVASPVPAVKLPGLLVLCLLLIGTARYCGLSRPFEVCTRNGHSR